MAAKGYYAVRKGFSTGVFGTWDECREATAGYSGAEYRKFRTEDEALAYLRGKEIGFFNGEAVSIPEPNDTRAVIYTDGAFIDGVVTYGVVIKTVNRDIKFCSCVHLHEYYSLHNILGELMGCLAGVQIAYQLGYKELHIVYDYDGVEGWYTGRWKSNGVFQQYYRNKLRSLVMELGLTLYFINVKSHSGVGGNTGADALARRAANLGCCIPDGLVTSGELLVEHLKGNVLL